MSSRTVSTYMGRYGTRPRARLHEVAVAFYPITLAFLVFLLSLWAGLGLFGTTKTGSQWLPSGLGMFCTAVFMVMYSLIEGEDSWRYARKRLDTIVASRTTRFHRRVIRAVPQGDEVVIHLYDRRGLMAEPHCTKRTFLASDDESIHVYVDQIRRGPDQIEHSPEAVAIARVINSSKH